MPVGKTPAGVLWLNGQVLVADMGTDYVVQVDPANGTVIGKIQTGKRRAQPVPVAGPEDAVGEQPGGRHHHRGGCGDAEADPQHTHPRRPG